MENPQQGADGPGPVLQALMGPGPLYFLPPAIAVVASLRGRSGDEGFDSFLGEVLPIAWGIAALILISVWGTEYLHASRERQLQPELVRERDRYVLPGELRDDAKALLLRAQEAKGKVLSSWVNHLDLLDSQRNRAVLPLQEFEIAVALRDYSRQFAMEPSRVASENVAGIVTTRRRALAVIREGVERRVAALEEYAAQVAEADARYRELEQIRKLTDDGAEVLDLLARTAGDDLAVAEIEGLTGQATAVAEAFKAALGNAKHAASAALPAALSA